MPATYLSGWFLAFAVTAVVTIRRLADAGAGWLMATVAMVLAGAQPHGGEVFFNLTSTQWWLGLGLFMAVILPNHQPTRVGSLTTLAFLALAGLSGPFAVLALPFLFATWALQSGQQHSTALATTVARPMLAAIAAAILLTAATQIGHIVQTPRMVEGAIDPDPRHWLKPLWAIATFGGFNRISMTTGLVFWIGTLVAVLTTIRSTTPESRRSGRQAALLLLAALVCLAAGLLSVRNQPHVLNPLQAGERYFVLPYGLAICAACLVWRRARLFSLLAILAFAWGSIHTRQFINRPGVEFESYLAMAQAMPIDTVPIHPRWPVPPGWAVPLPPTSPSTVPRKPVLVWPSDTDGTFESWSNDGDGVQRRRALPPDGWETTDPAARFSFPLPTPCATARYVGVEIEQSRTAFGEMQLRWQLSSDGPLAGQIVRMMPAGSKTAAFAFHKPPGDIVIEVSPTPGDGTFRLNAIRLHCLDETDARLS